MKNVLLCLSVSQVGAFDPSKIKPTHSRMLMDMYKPEDGKAAFTIDPDTPEFDRKIDLLVELLYPKLLEDPMYQENELAIAAEADEICSKGYDPRNPHQKIECEISRSGRTMPRSYEYLTPARKMKHLKLVVLWLQDIQEFGRYCYYGCHCMPEGRHNLIGKNWGLPVDDIDRSCKNFFQCYECAKMRDPECHGDRIKYKYKLLQDEITNEKSIQCLDDENTCQRNICECDKRWSENLQRLAGDFNPEYHASRSVKGKEGHLTHENRWRAQQECKRGGNKYGKPTECCGDTFPDVMPLQQGKQCCGHRTYDPNMGRQCCAGNKIREQC